MFLFCFWFCFVFWLFFCICGFLNCFEAKPHCNKLLAMPLEMVVEMSQSLVLVRQPTRAGHMGRIMVGHSTLVTSRLLIYDKQTMVHENDSPQPCKVIERYYKLFTIRKLPNWMGHLNACHQDNTPQTIIPLPHMELVSHMKCQP